MLAIENAAPTRGKMEAHGELRMHRAGEERIMAIASVTGLQETDFIRKAIFPHTQGAQPTPGWER